MDLMPQSSEDGEGGTQSRCLSGVRAAPRQRGEVSASQSRERKKLRSGFFFFFGCCCKSGEAVPLPTLPVPAVRMSPARGLELLSCAEWGSRRPRSGPPPPAQGRSENGADAGHPALPAPGREPARPVTRLPTVWLASCFMRLNCFFMAAAAAARPAGRGARTACDSQLASRGRRPVAWARPRASLPATPPAGPGAGGRARAPAASGPVCVRPRRPGPASAPPTHTHTPAPYVRTRDSASRAGDI